MHLDQQLKREKEQEQQAREVKALPLPTYNSSSTRQMKATATAPAATEAKPFSLQSEHRHTMAQANFDQQLQREQAYTEKASTFIAIPAPKTTHQPQIIKPAAHTAVVPKPMDLQSDKRSDKRKEFDLNIAKRMKDLQKLEESVSQMNQDKENALIKAMRSKPVSEGGMLFKAAPVQTQDLFPPAARKRVALTEPKSPSLGASNRRASNAPKGIINI